MSEGEVATYVLAYLLRQKYSSTAQAFLQECPCLPSRTLLILPVTPLQTIVADYKVRKDTGVLLDTLGPSSAWSALWEKMEQTLSQLRSLSDALLSQSNKASSGRGTRSSRTRDKTSIKMPHSPVLPPPSSLPPASSPPPTSSLPHTTTLHASPRRKQATPRHMAGTRATPRHMAGTSEEVVEGIGNPLSLPPTLPPSLDMQQILDTLLGSDTLPEKLAEIINQCVRDEEKGLSAATLDNILNLTCSEPAFEGLLPGPLEQDPIPIPPNSHSQPLDSAPSLPPQLSSSLPFQPSPSLPSPPSPSHSTHPSHHSPVAIRAPSPLQNNQQAVGLDQQTGGGGNEHFSETAEVPSKRPRLAECDSPPGHSRSGGSRFPTEMDIDRFLDQLHKQ